MREGLQPINDERTLPDCWVQGVPMCITTALMYFTLKHMQQWGAEVDLHPWDTWERLATRVEACLGVYLWHPSHWDQHYAQMVDVPASTPGAEPLTRAQAKARQAELFAQALMEAQR